ncbi:UNVERIFIED_CONTAM: hypothetical protein K2H54_060709 [Gekko kuhli]
MGTVAEDLGVAGEEPKGLSPISPAAGLGPIPGVHSTPPSIPQLQLGATPSAAHLRVLVLQPLDDGQQAKGLWTQPAPPRRPLQQPREACMASPASRYHILRYMQERI